MNGAGAEVIPDAQARRGRRQAPVQKQGQRQGQGAPRDGCRGGNEQGRPKAPLWVVREG